VRGGLAGECNEEWSWGPSTHTFSSITTNAGTARSITDQAGGSCRAFSSRPYLLPQFPSSARQTDRPPWLSTYLFPGLGSFLRDDLCPSPISSGTKFHGYIQCFPAIDLASRVVDSVLGFFFFFGGGCFVPEFSFIQRVSPDMFETASASGEFLTKWRIFWGWDFWRKEDAKLPMAQILETGLDRLNW